MSIELVCALKQTSENLLLFIFRTILSEIYFNYNLRRENKIDDQGNIMVKVTYPKFKDGEATVREMKVEQSHGSLKRKPGRTFSASRNTGTERRLLRVRNYCANNKHCTVKVIDDENMVEIKPAMT